MSDGQYRDHHVGSSTVRPVCAGQFGGAAQPRRRHWLVISETPTGLRNRIELLTELIADHDTGLLVTLDEIHHSKVQELREVAATVQHAFREGRDLALAGAGLAASTSRRRQRRGSQLLRRAERHALGTLTWSDEQRAPREPIEAAGRHIGDAALQVMVDKAAGYPFLLQLVGAQTWRLHLTEGRNLRRLGALIHEPALPATAPSTSPCRAYANTAAEF